MGRFKLGKNVSTYVSRSANRSLDWGQRKMCRPLEVDIFSFAPSLCCENQYAILCYCNAYTNAIFGRVQLIVKLFRRYSRSCPNSCFATTRKNCFAAKAASQLPEKLLRSYSKRCFGANQKAGSQPHLENKIMSKKKKNTFFLYITP